MLALVRAPHTVLEMCARATLASLVVGLWLEAPTLPS
jgi:hypothetical protein